MFRAVLLFLAFLTVSQSGFAAQIFYNPIFGVARTNDILYGTGPIAGGASFDLFLDIYRPVNIGTPVPSAVPAILLIHGGSFEFGTRNDMAGLASLYTTYGYTVASMSYRLSGQSPPGGAVSAAAQDSRKAMRFLYDNAATYGIDRDRLGIGGISAGAITSLFEAYNAPAPEIRPKAVLDFLGSMFGLEGTYIQDSSEPPAFVVHGTADDVVPFTSAVAVVNRMNLVGVYNEFYIQDGLGHTFDFSRLYEGRTLFQHNVEFLAEFLAAPEPSSLVLGVVAGVALGAIGIRNGRRRLV